MTIQYDENKTVYYVDTEKDGEERRGSILPGQIERAKKILTPELYDEVAALWTSDVIAAWDQKQAESEIA